MKTQKFQSNPRIHNLRVPILPQSGSQFWHRWLVLTVNLILRSWLLLQWHPEPSPQLSLLSTLQERRAVGTQPRSSLCLLNFAFIIYQSHQSVCLLFWLTWHLLITSLFFSLIQLVLPLLQWLLPSSTHQRQVVLKSEHAILHFFHSARVYAIYSSHVATA